MSKQDPEFNLATEISRVLVSVGCVTIVLIGLALGAGLFLDQYLENDRKWLTIIFMLGSVPISLFLVMRVVGQSMKRVQAAYPPSKPNPDINVEDNETI